LEPLESVSIASGRAPDAPAPMLFLLRSVRSSAFRRAFKNRRFCYSLALKSPPKGGTTNRPQNIRDPFFRARVCEAGGLRAQHHLALTSCQIDR